MIPVNKKIAVLHPHISSVGGAVNMMIFLSTFLQERGNKVSFFTFTFKKTSFNNIKLDINFVGTSYKIYKLFKIAYNIRHADIILVGNSPMQFVGLISKLIFKSKAKIIWWHHHYPWYYEKKHISLFISIKKFFEKLSIRHIDILVGNSLYIKNSLEHIFGKSHNIKLLYPVVNKDFYNLGEKKHKNSKITIFSYSRWVSGKNIKAIFYVYDKLKEKYDFNLLIGGEGEELEYFKNNYSKFKNINFLGFLDKTKIKFYLERSDIFLFPSLIDSFGVSVLEAMYYSLPVIGFDFGGVSELVKSGINGFLVKTDIEFAEKLEELLKDKTLISKFSKESYYLANTNFNIDVFNKQFDKLLI